MTDLWSSQLRPIRYVPFERKAYHTRMLNILQSRLPIGHAERLRACCYRNHRLDDCFKEFQFFY